MDKFEALAELMQDEAKAKEIFTESAEETLANLKAAGLEFTAKEMEEFAAKFFESAPEEELTEDTLDNVAGGRIVWVPLPLPFPFPFPIPIYRPRYPRRR